MARIDNYNEAKSWLAEWMAIARRGGSHAKKTILRAAEEQRANLEGVKKFGHSGWCNVAEYERSVKMIEAAARELETNQ